MGKIGNFFSKLGTGVKKASTGYLKFMGKLNGVKDKIGGSVTGIDKEAMLGGLAGDQNLQVNEIIGNIGQGVYSPTSLPSGVSGSSGGGNDGNSKILGLAVPAVIVGSLLGVFNSNN